MEQIVKSQIPLYLLVECCANDDRKSKYYRDIYHANNRLVHEIFRYQKFNYDFARQLSCTNTGEEVIGFIGPSYEDFIESVCIFLGVSRKGIKDENELTKKLNERIELLRSITEKRDLKKEFPYIYNDYIEGKKFFNQIQEIKQDESKEDVYNELNHYYYSCALKKGFPQFIETQVELYTRFVNKREEYRKLIEQRNYNDYLMKYFDKDKIALLSAYYFIEQSKKTDDEEEKRKCLKVVEKYLKSSYDKKKVLRYSTYQIDIFILVKNYLKEKYNKDIDLTQIRSIEELLQLVDKMKEDSVDWVIIPGGTDLSRVGTTSSTSYRQLPLPEVELERLRRVGRIKNEYYESTNYLAKVLGLMKYRGYVAYIYENGEILIDREYIEDSPRSATGCAIYNLRVEDFETLSKLDKTHLMHNKKVKRIIHSGDWKKKTNEIISQQGTQEDLDKAKLLIRRLQR